jgi:hypothetical protein
MDYGFAVADWNAATPEANRYSVATVTEFMQDTIAANDISGCTVMLGLTVGKHLYIRLHYLTKSLL